MAGPLTEDFLFHGRPLREWYRSHPLLRDIVSTVEVVWSNPMIAPVDEVIPTLDIGQGEIEEAVERLDRFAPYLKTAFPETAAHGGIIESPLERVKRVDEVVSPGIDGAVWIKRDDALPISGSIKARGGIYEVLALSERLARDGGLLSADGAPEEYAVLATSEARRFFSRYAIAVGSTGNLGLSIGIIGSTLGFDVTVHMSSDARRWKKERLRDLGVTVVEYDDDYGAAVAEGRRQAANDPYCHFVDDENSATLFFGYASAAGRLAMQLEQAGVTVSSERPLNVYLPCGVGGGPGGVAFGLKMIYKDAVRCYFAEPTHAPAMLLGLYTGLHEDVSVGELGIDGKTVADGLAVGRPSGFVGRRLARLIDGAYTVSDATMLRDLAQLYRTTGIGLEPSALAGVEGVRRFTAANHIVWATGGSMVPEVEMAEYIGLGEELLM